MKNAIDKTIKQAVVLGIISGMRTTFAPALLSHFLSRKQNKHLKKSRLAFMQLPATAKVTKVLSAGEITGDKLPNTPNRILPAPLIARVASGALAGAVISTVNEDDPIIASVIGGVTALASSYACFYLRKKISVSTVLKEPWIGAVEDAAAIAGGVLLMR